MSDEGSCVDSCCARSIEMEDADQGCISGCCNLPGPEDIISASVSVVPDLRVERVESCSGSCCDREEESGSDEGCMGDCCTRDQPEAATIPDRTDDCCDIPNELKPDAISCTGGCCPSAPEKKSRVDSCSASCCDIDDETGNDDWCDQEKAATIQDHPRVLICDDGCTNDCCGTKSVPRTSGCCPPATVTQRPSIHDNALISQDHLLGDCCQQEGLNTNACPCCVEDIIFRSTSQPGNGPLNTAITGYSNVIRRCCATLQKCCRRACCFLDSPTGSNIQSRIPPLIRACKVPSTENIPTEVHKSPTNTGSTFLQLEISGMDCPECMSKISRVLNRLPHVTAVETDYFAGLVQLRFDPHTISSETLIGHLVRGTGFGVKDITGRDVVEAQSHLTLPISFPGRPGPLSIYEKYDISREGPDLWNVTFRVAGEKAFHPREVVADLERYGGRLLTGVYEQVNDPATRDLRRLTVRTTLCVICTVPVLVLAWAPLRLAPSVSGGIQLGFATAVQILAAPMYSASARSIIFLHQLDTNVLAGFSTIVSYIYSIVAYVFVVVDKPFSVPFFETCVLLVTLIFFGRTVQAATRRSASSVVRSLRKLQSREAHLVEGRVVRTVDSRLLYYGDIIKVLPHESIVTDGVVISGTGDVDESSITGESVPVSKNSGNRVMAGTLNLTGTLHVQVTRMLHENSLARITRLIRSAQSCRAPLQDLADKFSSVVLPVSVSIACLSFLVWVLVDLFVKKRRTGDAVIDGVMKAIAVVVVSCPCAIGLAVPMVVAMSIVVLARHGILTRSADVLHLGKRVSAVAFDKTGTLSQGHCVVEKSKVFIKGAERVVYELVKHDKHPISQGVFRHLNARFSNDDKTNDDSAILEESSPFPGMGVRAVLDGYEVLGGKAAFTGAAEHPVVEAYSTSGLSLFTVTLAGTCLAVYGLVDPPRKEVPKLLDALSKMGKKVIILSGDNEGAVLRFAERVGVGSAAAFHSCTPEDKQRLITSLQSDEHEVVLFVGDGTNDGLALATADVSLAVGSGSEVAQTSAGGVLLGSDVYQGVMFLFHVSRAADLRMKMALGWCVVYMIFAIGLASGVVVEFSIEARWAGLGEVVSILPVVVIGLSMCVSNVQVE